MVFDFDVDAFVANPTLEVLNACRKGDLVDIARHYDIAVSSTLRVSEVREAVLAVLVEKGVLPGGSELIEGASAVRPGAEEGATARSDSQAESVGLGEGKLSLSAVSSTHSSPRISRAEVEVRAARLRSQREKEEREQEFQLRRELELKRLELDAATAREVEIRRLEAETKLKMRQLELQAAQVTGIPQPVTVSSRDAFDVSKNVQLVPAFRESEVESYFGAFERIACALHWPKDVWAILLQCRLSGKALEACASLSISDSLNYDTLKGAILRTYELVPEAYRQRFRGLVKTSSQSFGDFAREKSLLFDRWCSASKISNFSDLRELILLEEFKNCLPERINVYLNEQKVSTLQQASVLADEFSLTHKITFTREPLSTQNEPHIPHTMSSSSKAERQKQCFYCHQPDHLIANCEALKRKQQREPFSESECVGLVVTMPSSGEEKDNIFKPFLFEALVSLTGKVQDQRPVKVLRDTGSSQTLIRAGVLPLGASHSSVVVKGIEMNGASVPVHYCHVQSDLVNGLFPVAVCSEFPLSGVDFVMGNDIAGDKVFSPGGGSSQSCVPDSCEVLSCSSPACGAEVSLGSSCESVPPAGETGCKGNKVKPKVPRRRRRSREGPRIFGVGVPFIPCRWPPQVPGFYVDFFRTSAFGAAPGTALLRDTCVHRWACPSVSR